jgi:hypothetical protein
MKLDSVYGISALWNVVSIMIGLILGIGCCGINHTLCHTGYMVLVSII